MKLFIIVLLLPVLTLQSQDSLCSLDVSQYSGIPKVNKNDLICLAKNSQTKYTVFYSFTSWCGSCRTHLPEICKLDSIYNVSLKFILVESEQDSKLVKATDKLKQFKIDAKYYVLSDEYYGNKTDTRNDKFITEITPNSQELILGYGKIILINQLGEILYVSSWKDQDPKNWKDTKKLLEKKLIPLISQ